jgi:transcriptional regulator with XRE-family HTH domain
MSSAGRPVYAAPAAVGPLLKRWRAARRMSQLELALAAGVSSRHVSFVETGRSRPSREMLLVLSTVLDVPLRERNALLQAAGFAAVYRETALDDPEMAGMRQALELILRQHEPFGAVAMDRHWDILMANAAYLRFLSLLLPGTAAPAPLAVAPRPRLNALRMLFDPRALRPFVVNWPRLARDLLMRVHREASSGADERASALLSGLLAFPEIPADWREPDLDTAPSLVLPVELRAGEMSVRFFTTLTTLGAPQDVTLQELRIESFHAADAATEQLVRAMAAGA